MPDSPTEEKVEIHWVYTPEDYFDGKIELNCGDYIIEIEAGYATARMSANFYDSVPGLRDALTRDLNHYFLLWQMDRRKVFEIRKGSVVRTRPDGTTDTTIAVDSIVCHSSVGSPTLISTDANGVVHDPRRERFEAKKGQVDLQLRYASDPTAHRMLESFDASIRYPGNELVYLYEIWDALQTRFRRNKKGRH